MKTRKSKNQPISKVSKQQSNAEKYFNLCFVLLVLTNLVTIVLLYAANDSPSFYEGYSIEIYLVVSLVLLAGIVGGLIRESKEDEKRLKDINAQLNEMKKDILKNYLHRCVQNELLHKEMKSFVSSALSKKKEED